MARQFFPLPDSLNAEEGSKLHLGFDNLILSTETGFSEMMRDIYFHKQRRPKPGRFVFQGVAC
ncbi:hypothetical protein SDC9_162180 [bioreactor metagenome]|uniref:Uncharacterized protein n=1 Tax=bioreactor metagenome TaxID=1076179 RepID=A0A645FKE1_9ZZZZ